MNILFVWYDVLGNLKEMNKKLLFTLTLLLTSTILFAQSYSETKGISKNVISNGIGLGSAIAVTISWSQNKSILWAIIHGILSWFYVIYYYFTRNNDWNMNNSFTISKTETDKWCFSFRNIVLCIKKSFFHRIGFANPILWKKGQFLMKLPLFALNLVCHKKYFYW